MVKSAKVIAPTTPQPAEAVDPEAQLLAELEQARLTLETKQGERRNLLIASKTETEKLTADLKIKLSGSGLSIDEAIKLFAEPNAERGPHAELVGLYRKTARRRVHIVRLEKVIAQDRGDISQLEARIDDIQQKQQLKQAISQKDRDDARQVLNRATLDADERERQENQDPVQLDELNTAFSQVGESLRKRQSLLPKRTESKLEDLPALPKLEFETAGLAEKVLLESLQELLAEGREKAEELLGKQQSEGAISLLQQTFARIRQELAAFQKAPTWKSKCETELDEAVAALSEQLAGPYLAALEKSIPEARRQKDWGPVLSLLEELIRVAPKAKQLPPLMDELQELLAWRAGIGDIEARVAAERFNQLQQQLNRPTIDLGLNIPTPTGRTVPGTKPKPGGSGQFTSPTGPNADSPVDMTAWNQAQAALQNAAGEHEVLRGELVTAQDHKRKLLESNYETSSIVRQQNDTIAKLTVALKQKLDVVKSRLTERDRADQAVFAGYARHIADLEIEYKRMTDPNGEGTRPETDKAKNWRAKIARVQQRQQPYQPGADRAAGKGSPVDVAAEVSLMAAGMLRVITVSGIETRWRWIPAGKFKMGSPSSQKDRSSDENQVEVTLTRGFWMLETEVTQELWQAVMKTTLTWDNGKGPKHPVYNVSHDEAVEFCTKFNSLLKSIPAAAGLTVRLPWEAEWERAYRAGTTARFYWGDDEDKLGEHAWHSGNSNSAAHPVGQKQPNAWGLYDMAGNLWEWCGDWYDSTLPGGVDPVGASSGSFRSFRGGGWWFSVAGWFSAAYRDWGTPSGRGSDLGFRLAAVPAGR
ncbi:MAG: SUMF1/EgtB/PvdO family nonheme iron enzyme [Planctomycetaceae bacterium]